MAVIDPDAEIISRMMSRALADRETIRHQRQQIHGLVVALKVAQHAQTALIDLLDVIYAAEFDD